MYFVITWDWGGKVRAQNMNSGERRIRNIESIVNVFKLKIVDCFINRDDFSYDLKRYSWSIANVIKCSQLS